MRSTLILIISIFTCMASFGQASDFVSVKKKNNITAKSIFPGTFLSCRLVYGNDINGIVSSIHNDSLFIKEYEVRAVPNQWGTYSVDTLGSHLVAFHYRDIATVVFEKRESFSFIKNGTVFMIGGIGYAALNIINGKYLKESITGPQNRKSLGIALGIAGAGYIMNRIHTRSNRFDRKYTIVYTCMTCPNLKPF